MASHFDPKHWRVRALEMREQAKEVSDINAKETIWRLADDLDKLSILAEAPIAIVSDLASA